jgi:hypothetical protein
MNARIYGNEDPVKADAAGPMRRENPKSIMTH